MHRIPKLWGREGHGRKERGGIYACEGGTLE